MNPNESETDQISRFYCSLEASVEFRERKICVGNGRKVFLSISNLEIKTSIEKPESFVHFLISRGVLAVVFRSYFLYATVYEPALLPPRPRIWYRRDQTLL